MEGHDAPAEEPAAIAGVDPALHVARKNANDDTAADEPAAKKIKLEDDLASDQFADAAPQEDPIVLIIPQEQQQQPLHLPVVSDPSSNPPKTATSTESSAIANQPKATATYENGGDDDDDDDDLFGDKEEEVKEPSIVEPSSVETTATSIQLQPVSASSSKAAVPDKEIQQPASPATAIVPQSLLSPQQTAPEMAVPRKSPNGTPKKVAVTYQAPPQPTAPVVPPSKPQHIAKSNGRKTPGPVYGLPVGVHIPASIVNSRLLETEMSTPSSKLMEVLHSLPVNLINDALAEYDDAVEIKGAAAIRSHGAYLYGVVKRYVHVHERSQHEGNTGLLPMGEEGLTPAVHIRLEQLVQSGFCTRQEMNEKVKSKIRMLSEKDAMFALEELASVERHSIRNFGSYFMGILNRYMRGDHQSKIRPKADNKQPTMLGAIPHQQQQHQTSLPPGPFRGTTNRAPPIQGNSIRGDHRFNANAPNIGNNRRTSNRSNDNMMMMPPSNQQQQQQSWQQQQQQQPNNPMFNAPQMGGGQQMGGMMMNLNQPSNMGGMMNPPQPNNTVMGGGNMMGGNVHQPPMGTVLPGMQPQPNSNFRSNGNYGSSLSQQQNPQSFSSYQPYGGGDGMGGGMPALNPSQQQQQPRDAPYSQNPSQPLQQVGGGMYGQQTHPQQQPPNLYGGTGSINSNAYSQPPQPSSNLYGQRQQQLPSTSAFGQQSSNSYGGPSNSLPPPPGFAPLNSGSGVPTTYNMGGAPPVNQQQSYGPSFVTNPPGGTHQPPSYPQQPAAGGVGGGWNSNQQQSAIDILGLADKAASAIQALGSSNIGNMGFPNTTVQQQQHPQQQHYPPSSAQQQHPSSSYPPYSSGMGGQHPLPPPSVQPNIMQQQQHQSQPYFQQQQQQQQLFAAPQGDSNSQSGRRRTTAKLNELPLTVQYAVQNLVVTGAVSGQLDEGIMGMIIDLPEHLALSTLEKFASIDKSTMRNKTAYLAGVLRRELEKIHRR